jgi:hypothetical protein
MSPVFSVPPIVCYRRYSIYETTNNKVVQGTKLNLKEGDPFRQRRVSIPTLPGSSVTRLSIATSNQLLSPPAKSVIATAPEEHENQNNNQNSGHFCLHN